MSSGENVLISFFARHKSIWFAIGLVAVLLCGIGFICYRMDEPLWEGGHHGFHMAEYPHYALNYLRFGYLRTRFGVVTNYGLHLPLKGFSYRIDHPALIVVLISVAYRLFGISEWAARFFPVVMSIGVALTTGYLAYQLLNNIWGALLSLFFCLLSPMLAYYGRMPAPHNMALFFCMLFFIFYWRWHITQKSRYLFGMGCALVLGACTDWVIYFAPVAVFFHYLFFAKKPRKLAFIIALVISPVFLFGCYLGWTYRLIGNRALLSLWNTFVRRVWSVHGVGAAIDLRIVGEGFYEQFKYWVPVPVLALTLLGLAWLGREAYLRRITAAQGFILALFVFGLSHNAVFMNLALVHDFVMLYHLAPSFAIASTAVLVSVGERYLRRIPYVYALIFGVVIVTSVWQTYSVFTFRQNQTAADEIQAYWVGKALQREVSDAGKYVSVVDFLAITGSPRTYVAADRRFTRVATLDDFLNLSDKSTYEAIVVANSDLTDPDLRKYLVERYPRNDIAGYSIFALADEDSDILVTEPMIEHPYRIQFTDQITFLGYDIQEIVSRESEPFSWLDRYLNRHVELKPENMTTLRVANYWQKLTEGSTDCTLATHFETQDGQFRLERRYDGLDSLYPTSLWDVGQVIREEIEIVVPPDYPVGRYAMWIGVSCGSDVLAPAGEQPFVDANSRARVGQVYVRERATNGLPDALGSALARPVRVRVGSDLSLVHIEQSQEAVLPGDILVVRLTWLPHTTIEQNYKVFVHLTDTQGNLIAQHDAEPDSWKQPTSQWIPDVPVNDTHMLLIPGNAPAGAYSLTLGMYIPENMERLVIEDEAGLVPDGAFEAGKITVLPLEE